MAKRKDKSREDKPFDEWITDLARVATKGNEMFLSQHSPKQGRKRTSRDDDDGHEMNAHSLTKEERIEKRRMKQQQRKQRGERLRNKKQVGRQNKQNETRKSNHFMTERSLQKLSHDIVLAVQSIQKNHHQQQHDEDDGVVKETQSPSRRKNPKLNSQSIQPRKRDYGGLGLARPSLFIRLDDVSFIPKFETEFEEHVEGFFGKQRTKAIKKQSDGDMLWRRCLRLKQQQQQQQQQQNQDI